jgi:hypothetical protein
VREAMERRIFDEHLPCTPDGQASPFAATKMLCLPYISPISPLHLPSISPTGKPLRREQDARPHARQPLPLTLTLPYPYP